MLFKLETKDLFLDTNEDTSTLLIIELFESPSCKMCTGLVKSKNSGTLKSGPSESLFLSSELED